MSKPPRSTPGRNVLKGSLRAGASSGPAGRLGAFTRHGATPSGKAAAGGGAPGARVANPAERGIRSVTGGLPQSASGEPLRPAAAKSGAARKAAGTPAGVPGVAARGLTVKLKTARKRTLASQRWLERQLNDPYVAAAKAQGWRSRAAFKLIELDDKFHLLRSGMRVVDLGAAPGGWTQVAVKRGASVVGLDLLPIDPVPGSQMLLGDFNDPDMPERLAGMLGGKADLVLSDMAPNTSGHAATDHLRIMGLADLALSFALEVLAEGGAFVAKVFQGGSERQMLDQMKRSFASVKHAKPPASRKGSSELYVVATGFRGAGAG